MIIGDKVIALENDNRGFHFINIGEIYIVLNYTEDNILLIKDGLLRKDGIEDELPMWYAKDNFILESTYKFNKKLEEL